MPAHMRTTATSRPPLVLVATACAASVVVGIAATLLVSSEPEARRAFASEETRGELVRRFYDGVNETLRTGDPATLAAVLAPDFVAHSSWPDVLPGADGLIAMLLAIRSTSPGARLVVEAVHVAVDHVTARITVANGKSGASVLLPLGDYPTTWQSLDLFRLEGGRVAEHWGGPLSVALVQLHAEAQVVSTDGQDFEVRLSRRSYEPNALKESELAVGATTLFGDHGELSVVIEAAGERPAKLFRGPGTGIAEFVEARRLVTLAKGEALVLSRGTSITTSNDDSVPAEVLILSLAPWRATGVWVPALADTDGIVTETIAYRLVDSLQSTMTVRVGYVRLAPGGAVPLHFAVGMELLQIESGALNLTVDEPAWIHHDLAKGATTSRDFVLGERESAIVPAHASVMYRNPGSNPVRALVITIQDEHPLGSPP